MAAEFKFVFVAIGQGDFCMVRCPDGKIVVIDCGRTSQGLGQTTWVDETAILLRDGSWAGGNNNKVDALILTHPDADHYNQVVNLFNKIEWVGDLYLPSREITLSKPVVNALSIDKIYISNAYSDDSPLGHYRQNALHTNISGGLFNVQAITEVTINSSTNAQNYSKLWSTRPFDNLTSRTPINGKRLDVLGGDDGQHRLESQHHCRKCAQEL